MTSHRRSEYFPRHGIVATIIGDRRVKSRSLYQCFVYFACTFALCAAVLAFAHSATHAGDSRTVTSNPIWANNPPAISDFSGGYDDCEDDWVFEGFIYDEDPDTITIYFGGLLAGEDPMVGVDSDGYFRFTASFSEEEGDVIITATDNNGQSDSASEFVSVFEDPDEEDPL